MCSYHFDRKHRVLYRGHEITTLLLLTRDVDMCELYVWYVGQ